MTFFPSPAHRCLLPSFPFQAWWKSFALQTALKRKVAVDDCRYESVCCLYWLGHSLLLLRRLMSLICVARARLEASSVFTVRTGRCSFAFRHPSPQHPGIIWKLLPTRMPFHDPRGTQWPLEKKSNNVLSISYFKASVRYLTLVFSHSRVLRNIKGCKKNLNLFTFYHVTTTSLTLRFCVMW